MLLNVMKNTLHKIFVCIFNHLFLNRATSISCEISTFAYICILKGMLSISIKKYWCVPT